MYSLMNQYLKQDVYDSKTGTMKDDLKVSDHQSWKIVLIYQQKFLS